MFGGKSKKATKTENQLEEAAYFLSTLKDTPLKKFEALVAFLMKREWSRSAARHRANEMLGGGLLNVVPR